MRRTGREEIERLVATVGRFAGRRIALLGDLVADEFVHGDIARISREAPVLVLEQRQSLLVPGGGANTAANLRALGARPHPVGVVGRDEAGRRLVAALRATGISVAGIARPTGYRTPTKSRILAGGVHTRRQQIVRIDAGSARGDLPAAARAVLRRHLRRALERTEGLLVADYGYGAATPEAVARLRPGLQRRGLPVTVDSRSRIADYRAVTACTPNQEELEQAFGSAIVGEEDLAAAGTRLLRRTGNEAVLVTRGARGMTLFRRRSKPVHVAAFGSDEVADVTGAGDTVIATFTLALVAGAAPLDAARLSNVAAGLVVRKAGTATVSPDELVDALRGEPA